MVLVVIVIVPVPVPVPSQMKNVADQVLKVVSKTSFDVNTH